MHKWRNAIHELDILSTAKDGWQQDQTIVLMTRGGQKDALILIHSRWLKLLIPQDSFTALLHVWRAPSLPCCKTGGYLLNMIAGDTLITVAFRNRLQPVTMCKCNLLYAFNQNEWGPKARNQLKNLNGFRLSRDVSPRSLSKCILILYLAFSTQKKYYIF